MDLSSLVSLENLTFICWGLLDLGVNGLFTKFQYFYCLVVGLLTTLSFLPYGKRDVSVSTKCVVDGGEVF